MLSSNFSLQPIPILQLLRKELSTVNHKKFLIVLFFAILIVTPLAILILPKQTESELENRKLAKAPQLTFDSYLDKSFMKNTESYLSDHMILRTQLAKAKTRLEMIQGRHEVNGVFVGDKMLLEKIDTPNSSISNANIDAINRFAAKYKGSISTSIMIVPTAAEFYPSQLPAFCAAQDQTEYIKSFYAKLKNIDCIDAYAPLAAVADNSYIFYRTDHHWTSYGSYVGYTAMSKSLGYKPAALDMFNVEHTPNDFLGTLYSKVLYGDKLKDKIDLYHYAKENAVTNVTAYTAQGEQSQPSIFYRDYLDKKDKYSVFLGPNVPVVKIKTNVSNGKKLIIFKDSYSHSLMQFLPLHYEEIVLVDLRYMTSPLSEYIDMNEFQQALFLYNTSGFIKDSSVRLVSTY